jgi:hypothetical protein
MIPIGSPWDPFIELEDCIVFQVQEPCAPCFQFLSCLFPRCAFAPCFLAVHSSRTLNLLIVVFAGARCFLSVRPFF